MAGWSMVAGEEAVDFGNTLKNLVASRSPDGVYSPDSAGSDFEKTIKELVSLFRRVLKCFLVEFCSGDIHRPLPPVTSDGGEVDLFNLFVNVSHRGGFDAVSDKKGLWDKVAQESGLGSKNSTSAKMIYVKYLDALGRWLNKVIAGDGYASSVELSGISDHLMGKLRDFLSEVRRKYELKKGSAAMELGAELKWFIAKTKRRYDKYLIASGSNGAVLEIEGSQPTEERLMLLDAGNGEGSSPAKRKRECPLGTFKWLIQAAKDPFDPSIGRLPDRSAWGFYGSEEPWKQLLLFRASRTVSDPTCEKTWQKIKKMHPCLYDDSNGPGYNLRKRSFWNGYFADDEDRPCSRVGSDFQAEVPEWTGITTESDSKWLGSQIWPPPSKENDNSLCLIERDPIGRGRQDPCGCLAPGSFDCVRFHIIANQEKLILELGLAFYMWCSDTMGEGTLQYWTDSELEKLNSMMVYPPTLSPSFLEEVKAAFPSKCLAKVVSYYYNVALLQYRANQNRITHEEADSDTDQFYDKEPTSGASTSQDPVLFSSKKRRQ
ncbi:unnamed protein product [Microthlaspi erraticum]|uniref:ARID domain-containing protein n=1 Tax=Microthlaspi erraticum TaxID=1685480 RepID=A0A6D2HL43_9BRAS|nr:unnamed protein product [Microthlaspi erraticum]